MKTNNAVASSGYLCGVSGETCSSGNWIPAYADYITQYVRDYNNSGVSISHVGFLNEADASFSYDSIRSNGAQASQVITALRSALDTAGFTSVLINCCDFEGWSLSSTVLQAVKSSGAIDKLGGRLMDTQELLEQPSLSLLFQCGKRSGQISTAHGRHPFPLEALLAA